MRRSRRIAIALASIVAIASFSLIAATSARSANGTQNPGRNIAPIPNFYLSLFTSTSAGLTVTTPNPCFVGGMPSYVNTPGCTDVVLHAINHARASEHVKAMVLPRNWQRLTVTQQLFVVIDLERVDRGLAPYLGMNATLDASAHAAATLSTDPKPAPGFVKTAWGSVWAALFSPLEADYVWMYEDGWGGISATTNIDCTSATSSKCWGHREVLFDLASPPSPPIGRSCKTCEVGTGYASGHPDDNFTALIEQPTRTPPAMTFTWARNVAPFLRKVGIPHAKQNSRSR
jgi:hypothetical protein